MNVRRCNNFALLALVGSLLIAECATAQEKGAAKQPKPSLDDQLLDDLGSDLLDGLGDLPKVKPKNKQEAGSKPSVKRPADGSKLDDALEESLGEDLGAEGGENPLGQIAQKMRSVEERIAQRETSKTTQKLQQDIVDQLDEMIKQAKKNRRKNASSGSNSSGSRRSKVRQARNSPGSNSGRNSQRPARDSSERVGKGDLQKIDMAAMKALLKDIWGELPEREREQMMQNPVERFLPGYDLLIEKYFRRLAEDGREEQR